MDHGVKLKGKEVINIDSKYPILRGISLLYKVLSVFAVVILVIGSVLGVRAHNKIIFFSSFVGGLVSIITLLAAAEVIKVFLDIEENTRVTKLIKMAEYEEE